MNQRATDECDHVMIDLEALGLVPGSAIIEIGAVRFNPAGKIGLGFHRYVLPDAPLHVDLDTLMWHRGNGTYPRSDDEELARICLEDALNELRRWVEESGPSPTAMWSWGSAYDFPILKAAIAVCRQEPLVPYWKEQCARTVWRMAFPYERTAPRPHHALADCYAAVGDLCKAWKTLTASSSARPMNTPETPTP